MRYYILILSCLICAGCNKKNDSPTNQENILVAMTNRTSLQDPLFAWFHHVQQWFTRHAITYPLNLEYSVKITPDALHRARYVIQIPKAYVQDQAWFNDLFDTLQLPAAARSAMDSWMHNDAWKNVGLAVDEHHGLIYKAYVGYGYHEEPGATIINSIEFNEQGGNHQRMYKRITTHDCFDYIATLPKAQQKAIRPLIAWLHCAQALQKMSSSRQSICIKCKNEARVAIIKPFLRALAATITNNMDDVDRVLETAHDCTVSWIHLAPSETSWYFRSQRWFTPNPLTLNDH